MGDYTRHPKRVFGLGRRRLLDYLIRPQQQRLWDRQAERLRGLEVDDEQVLGRLLYWELGRLGTLQDFVDIRGGSPKQIREVGPIGDEAARLEVPLADRIAATRATSEIWRSKISRLTSPARMIAKSDVSPRARALLLFSTRRWAGSD